MNFSNTTKPELRYGAPACERILYNRHFTVGYSDYFRQAKWAIEIVGRNDYLKIEDRLDNFRADFRIPKRFRAGLEAYKGSGFDRGHLVPSANKDETDLQNSETFLLSNMSPQRPQFNRQIWRELEEAVRELDAKEEVLETYVITGPIFDFNAEIELIGNPDDEFGIDIPVPSHFFKSVLAELKSGAIKIWTFEMENKKLEGDIGDFLVKTYDTEQRIGGRLWGNVSGSDLHDQKRKIGTIWSS